MRQYLLILALAQYILPVVSHADPSELQAVPIIPAGATVTSVSVLVAVGSVTTTISVTFTDTDQPLVDAFIVTFKVREPDNITEAILANGLVHGIGGLTVTDNGGGSYTASFIWDPPDASVLGSYDLYAQVSDGTGQAVDDYSANPDELFLIASGAGPAVVADATFASPVGIERTGLSTTALTASFHDPDIPGIGAFLVTFKLRLPDNSTELVLASDLAHGQSGVSILDNGNGYYTASLSWDPPDNQTLGFYDLYFSVFEGADGSVDDFVNNLDELQVFDAISNNPPTVAAGAVTAIPSSVNRIGSEYTMLKVAFSDQDMPGPGNFRVTLKVRSPGAVETLLVDNGANGEQGLRLTGVGGQVYEASVLWDPPESAETGAYDLYFSVNDLKGGSATDDYPANAGELQVHATALAGDGYLLHRTREADNCGGPNSACHNLNTHQTSNCLTCHTAHGSRNIYLIKETIDTPNSGPKPVVVKTRGIGDPYNDPDPLAGDPNSGTLADDSDGVYTGVCEVCHTTTTHHRNDATTPLLDHNNATDCTSCHGHQSGFSGGESGGGSSCSCHTDILANMATGMPGFHHEVTGDPIYSSTVRTCLSCHVDHDLFRPDLNPGIGTRAGNLRSDATNIPVAGDNTVLANSDYSPTGTGGLCISCHAGDDCMTCHQFKAGEKAAFNHNFVSKTAYDAATSAHNYSVPSTFGTDGSVFNGNCVKCHNGTMAKNYQNSTTKFGLHVSDYQEILDPLGVVTPTSPLEEDFCFQCHSTTSNPNSGSSLDYYGSQPMSNAGPMSIEADLGLASTHPVGGFNGVHDPAESPVTMARHVECMDCHNPHEATADRPPSPALSGALYGVEGIMVDGSRIERSTNSYQICFKCHGDQHGTTPTVNRRWPNMNTRDEFKPTSQSFHPVTAPGTNNNSPSLISPWTETSIMLCEDCHGSSGAGAAGPHGSQYSPILKSRYDMADPNTESSAAYALCYSCHDRNSILGDQSFGDHSRHIEGENSSCYLCHDAHGVAAAGVGDGTHLINFNTDVVTSSSSGRLEFIDTGNFRGECYLTCHGKNHNPKNY